MYIKKLVIENIRSITRFEMNFPKPAGWHVLIGDNGSGKSTILRAISLALIGTEEAYGLRQNWRDWLNHKAKVGKIRIDISKQEIDKHTGRQAPLKRWLVNNIIKFSRNDKEVEITFGKTPKIDPFKYNWGQGKGWFSAAYGPYRRFTGGNEGWSKVFYAQPKLGAHLSVFEEDVALTESIEWLVRLNYQVLEKKVPSTILNDLKKLVNSTDFLPNGTKLDSVSSDGVFFKDISGSIISVVQLSDGYRSILSLTFELIRQLVRIYSAEDVFKNIKNGKMSIDLPGVVMIDEIDTHLHPSWQTRIGQWFTKYFPKMQFIVTTHSPLICRACEKGTIWRLAAPGSGRESILIKGDDRNRLIFGNVLDAYGTEVFGKAIAISKEGNEKRNRLGELNIKSILGEKVDENELQELKKIFPTEKITTK
jgi:predicted ATPase